MTTNNTINGANMLYVLSKEDLKQLKDEWLEDTKNFLKSLVNGNKDELLTAKQVREKFNIGSTTLWRWEQEGVLKPRRLGRKVFYQESDIINASA